MIVSVAIWNPGSELKLLAKTCREMEKDELSLSLGVKQGIPGG